MVDQNEAYKLPETSVQDQENSTYDLETLKNDFAELKKHIDETHPFDIWLNQLTQAISGLLQKEETITKEQFERHPELLGLMQEVVRKSKSWTDLYEESFSLTEEKKLLLDLMYSVLATIWRQEQERTVMWYSEEAITFFQKLKLWWLYEFLQRKAK